MWLFVKSPKVTGFSLKAIARVRVCSVIGAWRVNWSLVTRKSWEPPAPFRITGHRDRSASLLTSSLEPPSLLLLTTIDGLDDIDIRSILSFLVCLCLGYTYAGQVIFDKEALSSTYPDFYPFCSLYCGNTCCVPSDEWDGARAAAGD